MNTNPTGIHHVTAIAGEPQRNVDFYVGVLGLRLIKKTAFSVAREALPYRESRFLDRKWYPR